MTSRLVMNCYLTTTKVLKTTFGSLIDVLNTLRFEKQGVNLRLDASLILDVDTDMLQIQWILNKDDDKFWSTKQSVVLVCSNDSYCLLTLDMVCILQDVLKQLVTLGVVVKLNVGAKQLHNLPQPSIPIQAISDKEQTKDYGLFESSSFSYTSSNNFGALQVSECQRWNAHEFEDSTDIWDMKEFQETMKKLYLALTNTWSFHIQVRNPNGSITNTLNSCFVAFLESKTSSCCTVFFHPLVEFEDQKVELRWKTKGQEKDETKQCVLNCLKHFGIAAGFSQKRNQVHLTDLVLFSKEIDSVHQSIEETLKEILEKMRFETTTEQKLFDEDKNDKRAHRSLPKQVYPPSSPSLAPTLQTSPPILGRVPQSPYSLHQIPSSPTMFYNEKGAVPLLNRTTSSPLLVQTQTNNHFVSPNRALTSAKLSSSPNLVGLQQQTYAQTQQQQHIAVLPKNETLPRRRLPSIF